jgi:DNA-binding transcriptional ArsR family regulator
VSPQPVRRDRYIQALSAADRSPEVLRATGVAVALAMTARSDGTRASLSGPQLAQLFAGGGTDTTVRRHLRALREAGWLVQTEQGGRRGNKVFASIYSLSQPSTQVDARDEVPNRPRATLQPSTQVDASSPQRGPRPHLGAGSLKGAPHPVRVPVLFEEAMNHMADEGHGVADVNTWLLSQRVDPSNVMKLVDAVPGLRQRLQDNGAKAAARAASLPIPPPGLFPTWPASASETEQAS